MPVTLIIYTLFNHLHFYYCAKIWLVLASLYFYAQGSVSFFPFFLGSIFANYLIGSILGKMKASSKCGWEKKFLLLVGTLGNVGLLGYYKYTDFFISNYNLLTKNEVPLKNIILPIGISFFTFQLIAFLVDSYRGECETYDVLEYLLFITFFPQLIVGPIVHHSEVIPQFNNINNAKLNFDNIARGFFLFSIGCAKKIMFADILTQDAQAYFDAVTEFDVLGMADTWFHSIEYTVSYYFDLSGYADMAIGLGLLFNIVIPHNFNSPYKARNFQDYWRRWHMTLSRFLGDYIFKSVYRKNDKYRNFYVATMITFLVSGFWHGAGWTFVVWGLVNGVFVCTASWMHRNNISFPAAISYFLTAVGVVLTRVLFISPSFKYAWNVYKGMFHLCDGSSLCEIIQSIKTLLCGDYKVTISLIVGIFICWFLPNSKTMSEKFKPTLPTLVYAAILMVICILNMNHASTF